VLAGIVDDNPNELVVVAPPHAVGSVDVEVFIPVYGSETITGGFQYQDPMPVDMVRLLVPVASNAAGAFGSSWQVEFVIHNANSEPLTLGGASTPPGGSAVSVPAFGTMSVTLYPQGGNAGAFVYVPRRLADNVVANIRVHDTTRDGDSWGAELPAVPETQFRRSIVLIDVPTDSRYRTLLRVYGYRADADNVSVLIRDNDTGAIIDTRAFLLQGGAPGGLFTPTAPGYAQLALDAIVSPLAASHARVRVEVTATDLAPPFLTAPPIWAFVAITNNTTQQVTTITPTVRP
jgi:hypothetical protein